MTRIATLLALSMVLGVCDDAGASGARPGEIEHAGDATAGSFAPAVAAKPGSCGPRGRGGRGRMVVMMRIAEALELNEKQTAALHRAFRASAIERRALLKKRDDLAGQLERELDKEKPSEATLARLTNDVRGLDRQISVLPEKVFQSFEGELTIEQRARLALLRGKLRHRVEREHQRRRAGGANRVLGKSSGDDPRAADAARRSSEARTAGGTGANARVPDAAAPLASPAL